MDEEATFKTIKMYVSPAEQEELKERARAAHCSLIFNPENQDYPEC